MQMKYLQLKKIDKTKTALLILLGIVIFHCINSKFWLMANKYPSGTDEFIHLRFGLLYLKAFSGGLGNMLLHIIQANKSHWPTLYHLSSAVVNLFLGSSRIASTMVNIIYLAILLFSVYFIAVRLFDRTTGLLAAALLSMYPIIFRYSRIFTPYFAVTAMVALSICLLIYSDFFKQRRLSLLFGASLGLGMLVLWTYAVFLLGPLLYTITQAFLLRKREKAYAKQRLYNLSFALIIGLIIASLWYVPFS